MDRATYWLFIFCILGSIITYTQLPSYRYAVPILALGVFSVYVITQEETVVKIPRYLLVCLLLIWSVYLIHAFRSPDVIELSGRSILFIVVSSICIFLIPRAVPEYVFLETISKIATLLVVIGLPSIIIGSYAIGPIEVAPWHETNNLFPFTLPVIGDLPIMRSVFHNPNPMSEFVFVGFISSLYILDRDRSSLGLFMTLTTGFGLYLGSSRATSFAAAIASLIYIMYFFTGRTYLNQIVILCSAGVTILFLMFFRLIPAPEAVTNIDLTGRLSLWQGSIRAFSEHPIIGYGPGDTGSYIEPFVRSGYAGNNPHNSYLRLLVTTGIVGGISYIFIIFETVKNHSLVVDGPESAAILAILIGFSINQLFLGFSLFGISSSSVLAAITLGYSAAIVLKRQSDLPDSQQTNVES